MIFFRLTAKAKADLINIAGYTEDKWGRQQRNIYLKQFDDMFHVLSEAPELGTNCGFIKPGYRKFPQGSHVIFYKTGFNAKIEIVRILHKRMDVLLNLKNP
ncbi:MAG: type II toxin-antitoxin system RelE/ParE family toxin [Pseudohongiellaceae bacterium]